MVGEVKVVLKSVTLRTGSTIKLKSDAYYLNGTLSLSN